MSENINELKRIFEYEIKRKLSERGRSPAGEFRILMNGFKFYDYTNSGKLNQIEFVKGILRTGLSGFNESHIRSLFNIYDKNNTGYIDYRNFCNYLYGKEPLTPLSNTENETQNTTINNDINNNNEQKIQNQKIPNNSNQNQNISQKTPLNNQNNNLINNNNNIQNIQNQNVINSEVNQQNIDPNQTKEYFKKLIVSIKDQIHTNNGLTYYSFLFELKNNLDQNQNVSLESFVNSFKNIGLNISQNDILNFFNLLDFSGTGKVSIDDIINTIVDPMSEHRKLFVVNKFAKLDVEKQGEVKVSLLKDNYNPKGHPNVISGKETDEEIYKQFIYTLDIYCNIRNINENINYKQFVDYYNGISSSILDDKYFEDILNGVWSDEKIVNSINNNLMINNKQQQESIQINQKMNQMEENKINNNNRFDNLNTNNERYNNGQNNRVIKIKHNNVDSVFSDGNMGINSIFLGEPTHVLPKSFAKINCTRKRPIMQPQNNNINNINNINNTNNNRYQNNPRINNNKSNDFIQNNYNKPSIIQNQEIQSQSNINQFQPNNYYNNNRNKRSQISFNPITNEYSKNGNNNYSMNNNQNTNININNNSVSTYNTSINSNINSNSNSNNNNNIIVQNNNGEGKISEEQMKEIIINSLNKLKNTLIVRGVHSLFSFQRKLSLYDLNHQSLISFDNFLNIVKSFTMNLSPDQIQIIFDLFDKDKTGLINYNELIKTIIGQISPQRKSIIQKAFEYFNKDNNGKVPINDIKLFDSRRHPDVINGKRTEGEVLGEFLDIIESYREYLGNLRGIYDNSLSKEDFIDFFNEIGIGFEDDKIFEFMLFNCWNLGNNNMSTIGINNMGRNRYRNNFGNNNTNEGNLMARAGSQIIQNNIF